MSQNRNLPKDCTKAKAFMETQHVSLPKNIPDSSLTFDPRDKLLSLIYLLEQMLDGFFRKLTFT